jgi:hypothetical protein
MKYERSLSLLAVVDVALVGAGIGCAARYDQRAWLSFSMAALAVVTFFWLMQLWRGQPGVEHSIEHVVRRAIACSTVVLYLASVGIVLFYAPVSEGEKLHPATELMLSNFTILVGVIIAFYFSSSAYIQARSKDREANTERDKSA